MLARRVAVLLVVCVGSALWLPVCASASTLPAPGWEVFTRVAPGYLPPGGEGRVEIFVYNVGAASGEDPTVTDVLPAGVTATGEFVGECTGGGTRVVTCKGAGSIPVGEVEEIAVKVKVASGVVSGSEGTNQVSAAGGGTLAPAEQSKQVRFSSTLPGFGVSGFDAWFTNADGMTDTQAGSHPYELTVVYSVNSEGNYEEGVGRFENPTGGEARHIVVNLPPGVVGNPTAVPRCTVQQFDGESRSEEPSCPASTQIGVDEADVLGIVVAFKLYNLVPPPGVAAQFGFDFQGNPVFLDARVRTGGSSALSGDYGISASVENIPQKAVLFNRTTIWGVPGEESHAEQRGGLPSGTGDKPFLTVPTSCEGPQEFSIEALGTWQDANLTGNASMVTHDSTGTPVGFIGCDHMAFAPAISVSPDTSRADSPAGMTVEVEAPEQGLATPEGLSTSNIKDTTVTLPAGVAINPGQAAGLVACQYAQDGMSGEGPPECPAASKVGTVEIETPLLAEEMKGNVYILPPDPPNIQLLVAASGGGVNLKLIGHVHLDEATGQLTTTFSDTPELPFSDLKLSFSGGAQAALATPTLCGSYETTSDFTPWTAPLVQDAYPFSSFAITSGPDGTACQDPLPFAPEMIAGATTDQAGGYTDFSMLLQRGDGQQRIKSLQFKTPEGLLGMISKVPLCGEPQAAEGTCPGASEIGHTVVTAGPGPYPLVVPEPGQPPAPIYLTGSYKGAPYGLAIVVPVIAGPFNLGTTVVRGRIEVDPETSQLTITTDPLPVVLDGVPVDMRTIDAVIDRKEFMFNPTNCNPQAFSGTATSVEGTQAALSSPFQVGSCRSLTFKPGFKVSTSAKTSRTQGASLRVTMTLPDEGGLSSTANVQRVKVSLPKQLPTPLKTLQKACLEKTFAENPKNCPVASQVGTVKVSTPVLQGGLTGTAYFVSHGGAKYPELIMVLVGENGVTVQVHGETQISKAGITTATFATVPDVPFSNFELTLPQREFPALTANGNLCKGTLLMPTELVGQNGLVISQNTKIAVTGCPKTKKATHKKKAHHKAAKGKRKKK